MAVIRQLCLNIPVLFLLDALFGMNGIIWTQLTAADHGRKKRSRSGCAVRTFL